MFAYISPDGINVMCLYLKLYPKFKSFCEKRTCDQCLLSKYFSDDTDEEYEHKIEINEGMVLFLSEEKPLKQFPRRKEQ
jgi:hypothetical protein